MPWYTYRCQFHFPAETTASSLQLSGFGINNCQLMLSCPLPLRRSSLDWQAARQLRRQFRDICPVFICTSARFYQLQGLGCYRLSQALNAHLPCTTLLNSEDLCIIGREREREREKPLDADCIHSGLMHVFSFRSLADCRCYSVQPRTSRYYY